jgi:hypothetical protein
MMDVSPLDRHLPLVLPVIALCCSGYGKAACWRSPYALNELNVAPCPASTLAVAAPSPREPPATNETFPLSRPLIAISPFIFTADRSFLASACEQQILAGEWPVWLLETTAFIEIAEIDDRVSEARDEIRDELFCGSIVAGHE